MVKKRVFNKEEQHALKYKETGDIKEKEAAVKAMSNLIYSTISGFNRSQGLDNRVLYNKGLGIALKAVDSWDPDKAKLSTHVVNQLKPLQRDVYKFSPILHIPEHRIGDWQQFQATVAEYEAEYGAINYDPLILSDMSGLPVDRVKELLKENKKVWNTSTISTTDVKWPRLDYKFSLDLIETDFDKDEDTKKVWKEIKSMLENGETPNASEVARRLNMKYTQVNKIYNMIVKKINDIVLKSKSSF